MGQSAARRATLADFLAAEAEGRRVELIGGELVDKELEGSRHSGAHGGVTGSVFPPFRGRGDGTRPGGWTFKIDASLAAPNGEIVCPDVSGWRRERAPPEEPYPIVIAPDWACEVAWATLARDLGHKLRAYHAMGIGHYWVLDLKNLVLTVYRREPPGYVVVTAVGPEAMVRLEPFDAVELPAWELFGFEDPPVTKPSPG